MVMQVRTYGNCWRENAEFTGVVLETDEEMEDEDEDVMEGTERNSLERMRRELHYCSRGRRDLCTHRIGSYLWPAFSREFEPYLREPLVAIWYIYYARVEDFIALFQNRPMYVHCHVLLLVPATFEIRSLVYRLFVFDTPFNAY